MYRHYTIIDLLVACVHLMARSTAQLSAIPSVCEGLLTVFDSAISTFLTGKAVLSIFL